MLNIIFSGEKRGGADEILRRIKYDAEKGGNVLFVVPEQAGFEMEILVCDTLGSILSNKIDLTNFSKISASVILLTSLKAQVPLAHFASGVSSRDKSTLQNSSQLPQVAS